MKLDTMKFDDVREHNRAIDGLEALVDKVGFAAVQILLAEVASTKADRARELLNNENEATFFDNLAAKHLEFKEAIESKPDLFGI